MKSQLRLIILLSLLLSSCLGDDPKTKTLDFEHFTIEVPANWRSFSSQGYDSQVGGITNGKVELTYDYGWYSNNFESETTATHIRTETTIDGKPALIVQPIKKGKGIIGVYIEVGGPIRFSLMGRDIDEEDKIRKIFQSVKFHNQPV